MNQLWFDGYDWYIAGSAGEAQKLQIEFTGADEDRDETNEFTLVPEDQDFTFYNREDDSKETKKVKDWLVGRTKGFFASTEY